MAHMVAQEHLGYVDALRYGTARTEVTLAAALSAIGSTPRRLVPTFAGDGVWTIGSNLTSPSNVTFEVPPGVTINVAAGVTLTINGPIIAYAENWKTGTGTLVRGAAASTEITPMQSSRVNVISSTTPDTAVIIASGLSGGFTVPSVTLQRDPAVVARNWTITNNVPNYHFMISHPGANPNLAMNDVGLWVGNGSAFTSPAHLLHLQLDDAFKPGDGTWDFPSDARLKDVQGVFPHGLTTVQALPAPVVYTLNGKAETPVDGTQYVGMIAQDVEPVAPFLLSTYEAKLDPSDADPTTLYRMNESPILYLLINAVRELATRVEALEAALVTRQGTAAAEEEPDDAAAETRRPRRRQH